MGAFTYFLGGVLQPFLLYMVWAFMLEPRWKKRPFWCYAIIATIAVQIPTLIRSVASGFLYELMAYGQLAVLIAFAIILFKDKAWTKVFIVIMYYVSVIVAEIITFSILGDSVVGLDFFGDSLEALIVNLLVMIISFCMLGVLVIVWNLLLKKQYVPKNIVLFLLFPIGQICMIDIWSKQLQHGDMQFQSQFNMFLGLFIGFVADAILFYVMLMQGEREEVKRQLAETEKLMELERNYYQSVKERQEEVAKIRHDFNNQLTAALQMVQSGEQEQSKELLEELRKAVENSRERKWCDNAVVNAVVAEKYRECVNRKIMFDAEIVITEDVPVNPLHLCSVFSNLLDNAIHAAVESGVPSPTIVVRTMLQEKYLYIKVENDAKKPTTKVHREGHGYGLQIIKNIAQQYNGEYQGGWENGVYQALVVLEVQGK
ncbi:MAG: GHKL domain-containing protein [Roseburia sp.]|nr:GHKL domain-containing protein [Roseburia sp.]